jgi:hypothetical protein
MRSSLFSVVYIVISNIGNTSFDMLKHL